MDDGRRPGQDTAPAGRPSGLGDRRPGPAHLRAVVAAAALAWAAPLALFRYFPGLDLPWHAVVVAVLQGGSQSSLDADFLGYFSVDWALSSYVTLYAAAGLVTRVCGDVAVAFQIVTAVYVVAMVHAAWRFERALGGSGAGAVLAAPAAYSVTLAFGFLAYALTYPMTLWLWAQVVSACRPGSGAGRGRARRAAQVAGILGLAALLAITHPFAAVIAVAVGVILALVIAPAARAAVSVAALAAGLVPAVIAVAVLGGARDGAGSQVAGSLWDRLLAQQFTPPVEAIAAAPARLFGLLPAGWAYAVAAAGIAAAVWARRVAGPPAPVAPVAPVATVAPEVEPPADTAADTAADAAHRVHPAAGRAALWVVVALAAAYLVTPYTFEWPRRWHGAQPRLLPLLWVAAVVALRGGPGRRARELAAAGAGARWRRWLAAPVVAPAAVSAAALAVLVATSLAPHARESADFGAVVDAAAPRARTLALVEQPRAFGPAPAGPWRHAGGWVVARRGGFTAHLPMTAPRAGNAGVLVPVRLADGAPPVPRAPAPGYPRTFDWDRHAAGWDQFVIRDLHPDAPHDYFGAHTDDVALVLRRGRWRLYRRVR